MISNILPPMGEIYEIEPPSGPLMSTDEAITLVLALEDSNLGKLYRTSQEYIHSINTIFTLGAKSFEMYPSALSNLRKRLEANLDVANKLSDWAMGYLHLKLSPSNKAEVLSAMELAKESHKEIKVLRELYAHLRDQTQFFDNSVNLNLYFYNAIVRAEQSRILLDDLIRDTASEE